MFLFISLLTWLLSTTMQFVEPAVQFLVPLVLILVAFLVTLVGGGLVVLRRLGRRISTAIGS